MRPQTRPAEPTILTTHGEDWTKQWLARRAKATAQGKTASFAWPKVGTKSQHYNATLPHLNHHLREPLSEMTQGHCAFCDTHWRPPVTSKPTIEHFRPKSLDAFADLAFKWTNLYCACHICQEAKQERWDEQTTPLAPTDGYTFTAEFRANPDGSLTPLTDRARSTEQLYKLNTPEMIRGRWVIMQEWDERHLENREGDLDSWPYRDFMGLQPISPTEYRQRTHLS